MTKSTITREQLLEIIETDHVQCGEASYLARMALAAMDSEPVIVVGDDGGDALAYRRLIQSFAPGTKLYRHAQPAPERDQVRREHAEWSQATFGDVGPVGPLKHLSKEALEAAAEPGDLSEWADMQFLLWDAQRRAGITDEQITQAMIDKMAVNKQREWPEPKDGEPRLHIKEQPAQVVNGEYGDAYQGAREDLAIWKRRALEAEESVRRLEQINDHLVKEAQGESRMGEPVIAQPAPVVPDAATAIRACLSEFPESARDIVEECADIAENACLAAMLAAAPHDTPALNSVQNVVTVPGKWIPVSERMPEDEQEVLTINKMGHRFVSFFDKHSGLFFDRLDAPAACCIEHVLVTHWMPLPAAPQEVKGE
ncbi:TPA: dATP/dGTP pyrophosphohydrolase domain-containing protein [Klebsiella pneumoniae]